MSRECITRGLEKQRLVLENRRLTEELGQRDREIEVLLAVSQSISQSFDLQKILDSALEKVAGSMSVEAGFLYLLENGQLTLKGSYGFNSRILKIIKVIKLDDAAADMVFLQGEPLVRKDTARNDRLGLVSLAKFGYRAYACVQLTMEGESIGIMGVATTAEHDFSPREVDLLNAIGREISIAVRYARLNEEASSARALRELDARRKELLANVSHELRTPLSAIKGFAGALLQEDVTFDGQTQREFIQTIDIESDRLNDLIEQLLTMSRLEAGALKLSKEWCDIRDVVDSIQDRLSIIASKRKLKVAVPRHLPLVSIDSARIGQVITNLVDNAAKYSNEGTQITLEARSETGSVVVSVNDEGIGIPVELQAKIFERFYQVKGRHKAKGVGLGLSICQGIIEAHRGRIWVESQPGKGSIFRFSLPIN